MGKSDEGVARIVDGGKIGRMMARLQDFIVKGDMAPGSTGA